MRSSEQQNALYGSQKSQWGLPPTNASVFVLSTGTVYTRRVAQRIIPFTKFRFLERYQRDVSLTKEQNFDSRRSPRAHNFVLSSGISAMCRSQKNRISIRAARSAGTQFRFIGRYKRNTLKRTENQYKAIKSCLPRRYNFVNLPHREIQINAL